MKKSCAQRQEQTGTEVDSLRKVAGWMLQGAAIGKNNPTMWRAAYYCLNQLRLGAAGRETIDAGDLERIALTKAKEWEAAKQYDLIALQIYETLGTSEVNLGRQLKAIEGGKGFSSLAKNTLRTVNSLIKEYGAESNETSRTHLGEAIVELLPTISSYTSELNGTPLQKEVAPLNRQADAAERAFVAKRNSFRKQRAVSVREAETASKTSASVQELCSILQQLRQITEAEGRERRVDNASGTINLRQKRQLASARIYAEDRRAQLTSELGKAGYHFDQKRDCRNSR